MTELSKETIELINILAKNDYSDTGTYSTISEIAWIDIFARGSKQTLTSPSILASAGLMTEEQVRDKMEGKWVSVEEHGFPEIGKLVTVYRNIESKQIYTTIWNEENERFAHWNEITFWKLETYPPNQ